MKLVRNLISLTLVLSMVLVLLPSGANASSDCFNDPVYTRSFTATPNISLNLRDVACIEGSAVISVLSTSSSYNVIAETDGWYKVKLANGTVGWAGSSLMTVTGEKANDPIVYEEKVTATDSEKLAMLARVSGHILLQVENNGEAWYVHPLEDVRYYMKDGSTAYEMLRKFGLGISNVDLDAAFAGNQDMIDRLRGRIVLQVEKNGEAYYIHPTLGTLHYLKDGPAAYQIMRELSLGITNADLAVIEKRTFTKIEYTDDEKQTVDSPEASSGIIDLVGVTDNSSAYLAWETLGFTSEKGFKVVKSLDSKPVYPGNPYHYLSDPGITSDTWSDLTPGLTYHFRVCEYLGGACGVYSNDVAVTVSGVEPVAEKAGFKSYQEDLLYNFSMLYPEYWDVDEPLSVPVVQIFSPVSGSDQFSENVNIVTESLQGYDLDHLEYTSLNVQTLKSTIDNYTEIRRDENVKLGELSAFRLEYTGSIDGISVHRVQWYTVAHGTGYVITYTGDDVDGGFDQYLPLAEEMVASFKNPGRSSINFK